MFIKILIRVFFFFFLPNSLFFYSCYLNDLFNIDIFNLKKIDNLDSKIQELKNSIENSVENHSTISKNIDKNVSNSNNILMYIIAGCFIAGFFYLGYNFFNNNSPDVGRIIIENSSSNNHQSLVQEISGTSKMILENQNKNVLGVLKSISTNTRDIEHVVISNTETTRKLIATENSFIHTILINIEESIMNLNNYINQNVEIRLINMNKKINILQNILDKLISASDFLNTEEVKPDISPFEEEEKFYK
jgi:hypothetical protein